MTEPTFFVVGEERMLERLAEVTRRRSSLNVQFEANEREYEGLIEALNIVEAEERDLRVRLRG